MYVHTTPTKPSVRSTHCDRKPNEQTNQIRGEANRTKQQAKRRCRVAAAACVWERESSHSYAAAVAAKAELYLRERCMNERLTQNTHTHTHARQLAAEKKGAWVQLTNQQQAKYIRQSRSHVKEKLVIHNACECVFEGII